MLTNPDVGKRVRISMLIAPACFAVSLLSACLLDDERCGPNMVLSQGLCMCVAGASVKNNVCVIVDAGGPAPMSGLGAVCSESVPCTDQTAPLCQTALSGERYCTSTDCARDADCATGYRCITSGSGSYCRRPSTGQGETCATTADCEKFDAKFCSMTYKFCLIRDCTADSCDVGYTCWDASMIVPGAPFICRPEVPQ